MAHLLKVKLLSHLVLHGDTRGHLYTYTCSHLKPCDYRGTAKSSLPFISDNLNEEIRSYPVFVLSCCLAWGPTQMWEIGASPGPGISQLLIHIQINSLRSNCSLPQHLQDLLVDLGLWSWNEPVTNRARAQLQARFFTEPRQALAFQWPWPCT